MPLHVYQEVSLIMVKFTVIFFCLYNFLSHIYFSINLHFMLENTWVVVSLFLVGKLGITSAFGTSKYQII